MEYKTVQFNYDGDHVEGDEWSLESIARVLRKAGCAVSTVRVRTSDGETADCSMCVTIPENGGKYRQSMSAVVCVYPSGQIDLVSLHHSIDAAYDYLDRIRETGEAGSWRGSLVVVPGAVADVYGILDHPKLLTWLDFTGIEYREG